MEIQVAEKRETRKSTGLVPYTIKTSAFGVCKVIKVSS